MQIAGRVPGKKLIVFQVKSWSGFRKVLTLLLTKSFSCFRQKADRVPGKKLFGFQAKKLIVIQVKSWSCFR